MSVASHADSIIVLKVWPRYQQQDVSRQDVSRQDVSSQDVKIFKSSTTQIGLVLLSRNLLRGLIKEIGGSTHTLR